MKTQTKNIKYMTTEEKAKAYDEALEKAKKQVSDYQKELDKHTDKSELLPQLMQAGITALVETFPQLAESEDEKIRKELLSFIESVQHNYLCATDRREKWIAYLEKQKDHFRDDTKMVELQDYYGLNDLERAIHRGFLSAGVENVPVTIIKETAQECLAQMNPAEWSEDDEQWLEAIIREYEERLSADKGHAAVIQFKIDFLKSLRSRPKSSGNWKPNEEQMEALKCAIEDIAKFSKRGGRQVEFENEPYYMALHSLYEQLEKLM